MVNVDITAHNVEYLKWLYMQMQTMYREDSRIDFMRKLKSIIDRLEDKIEPEPQLKSDDNDSL